MQIAKANLFVSHLIFDSLMTRCIDYIEYGKMAQSISILNFVPGFQYEVALSSVFVPKFFPFLHAVNLLTTRILQHICSLPLILTKTLLSSSNPKEVIFPLGTIQESPCNQVGH